MPKLNPKPIQDAIAAIRAARADIAGGRQRKMDLQKEVDDYLGSLEKIEEEDVKLCSAKKSQIELLPVLIARVEEKIGDRLIPTLIQELEAFERALKAAVAKDREAWIEERLPEAEKDWPPVVNNLNGEVTRPAIGILAGSARCPRLAGGNGRNDAVGALGLPVNLRSNYPDPEIFDAAVIARAEEILEIAASYAKTRSKL